MDLRYSESNSKKYYKILKDIYKFVFILLPEKSFFNLTRRTLQINIDEMINMCVCVSEKMIMVTIAHYK